MTKNVKTTSGTSGAFRTLAVDTYNAFIEWPIWLVLRRRELDKHLAVTAGDGQAAIPATPTTVPSISPASGEGLAQPKASVTSKLGQKLSSPDALAAVKAALEMPAPGAKSPAGEPGPTAVPLSRPPQAEPEGTAA